MKFNLNLLKFHSFKLNKNFTNYIDPKYSWKKFWDNLNQKILHMEQFKKFANNLTGKKDHFINEKSFDYLFKNIITFCHPNLKNELYQLMENIDSKEKKYMKIFVNSILEINLKK